MRRLDDRPLSVQVLLQQRPHASTVHKAVKALLCFLNRKKNEKLIACLEGTDAAAKKERVLKAVNGCKEEGKVKEEMKSCINEKMAFTDEEKKCVEAAEKS
ncbi:uncharacterized protein LOC119182672 isoform X1 [Rhipicephalus microplus]|uniref:uncharacterized protein LOC119182672 isoform X1 n=1 Tax=Rhipicephalus microplus TaxID=6941 RepID=UPI003F6CB5E2